MNDHTAEGGRDQLIRAAMRAVARHGSKGATVRLIAADAGVTNGLIVHHFGTKGRLIAEVDALVLDRLRSAMTVEADITTPTAATEAIATQLSSVIGGDPDLRSYLRRSMLEATPAGRSVFRELIETSTAQLRRFGSVSSRSEQRWLAVQILSVNLAGLLFEPFLAETLGGDPFSTAAVDARTTANRHFIETALAINRP